MSRPVPIIPFIASVMLLLAPAVASADEQTAPATAATVVAPERTQAPLVRAPVTAEEKALRALDEEALARVRELVRSMTGLPDGPALRELQRKVEDVKRDHRVSFLRVKLQFARQRGDLATAQECEQRIERILNPPRPTAIPDARARERTRETGGRP